MAVPRPAAADGSSEELLRGAAAGDAHAFARIVRLHHESMTRVALVVTGDLASATDAATRACASAWSSLRWHRPRHPAPVERWLARLAADEAARRLADDRMLFARLEDYGVQCPEPPASPLDAVPVGDRRLLALVLVGGLTPADIAGVARREVSEIQAELERVLTDASRTLAPDADATSDRGLVEARVRTLAARDVPPVDADRVARLALGAQVLNRQWLVSVVIGLLVGLAVAALPYWAPLLGR
jgi:DNA-directed RNA polymerase specialized sigma24 family protein